MIKRTGELMAKIGNLSPLVEVHGSIALSLCRACRDYALTGDNYEGSWVGAGGGSARVTLASETLTFPPLTVHRCVVTSQ